MSLRSSQEKGAQQGQTRVRGVEKAISDLGESSFRDGGPGRLKKLASEEEPEGECGPLSQGVLP